MTTDEFDVIVVGAGMAGLCCAGELVVQGLSPLLICESTEVAYQLKSHMIGNTRCLVQHPTRQVGWGGGWWFQLVRALNLPIKMHRSFTSARLSIHGSGSIVDVPTCPSAAALADVMLKLSPIPIEKDQSANLERVLERALAIPYAELVNMQEVPLAEWLEKQEADPLTQVMFISLGAAVTELNAEDAAKHLSVFGCIGMLRSYLCGESDIWSIAPDAREGLALPIANEVERRGGAVWRGRRARQVLTEGGRAVGVVLEDGTEVRAPTVALACANRRIASLLDPMPAEIGACLAYDGQLSLLKNIEMYAVLDKQVDPNPRAFLLVMEPHGAYLQVNWSISDVAPWTTEPGRYLVASERVLSPTEISELGGVEGVVRAMREVNEEVFPGYNDALVDYIIQTNHQWATPYTIAPKLPRRVGSIPGLWCVGDTSAPVGGVYMETACSAGILGARSIAEVHAKSN